MFLEFYGLREQPFGVTPDHRFMYLSPAHREALASLYYGIEAGRGFLVLTAKPGMGKTTLLFHLLDKFHNSARTAFLFQTQCGPREFMRFLLADLGIERHDEDFVRLHEEFNKLLLQEAGTGRRFIVVVDEAQNLDATVMETLRLLSDFETPRAKLLQIVLSGQPELVDKLASQNMAQLRQRVSMLNRLMPLSIEETRKYIAHRLTVAGHSGPLPFTEEALVAIARFTEGIPRNINNFCFTVLSLGCALRSRVIDPPLVEEVINDLDISRYGYEAGHPAESKVLRVATDKSLPSTVDTQGVAETFALGTLTPAQAKDYMRQLALQLGDWKRKQSAGSLAARDQERRTSRRDFRCRLP